MRKLFLFAFALLSVSLIPAAVAADDEPKCREIVLAKWDNVLLVDNGPSGLHGQAMTYSWFRDGQLLAGETSQVYYAPEGLDPTAAYHAEVMLLDSTIVISCEHTPDQMERASTYNGGEHPLLGAPDTTRMGNLRIIRRRSDDGSVEVIKQLNLH